MYPPPPCFCVCAGMIGLMGAFRGCAGIIGLSMRKSEEKTKDESVARSEMAQERRPLSITD
jgi:predicted nucleic acid-binding Zn finger protein